METVIEKNNQTNIYGTTNVRCTQLFNREICPDLPGKLTVVVYRNCQIVVICYSKVALVTGLCNQHFYAEHAATCLELSFDHS